MKRLLISIFLLSGTITYAQFSSTDSPKLESLKHQLATTRQDTSRVLIMVALCNRYRSTDSARLFGQQALTLAQKIHFPKGEIWARTYLGREYAELGNLPKGFQMQLKALQVAEENHLEADIALPLNQIGNLYGDLNDFDKAASYYKRALTTYTKYNNKVGMALEKMQLARAFEELNRLDSALYYVNQSLNENLLIHRDSLLVNPLVYRNLARIHSDLGNRAVAFRFAHKALTLAQNYNFRYGYAFILVDLGIFFKEINRIDSSIYYTKLGLNEAQQILNKRIVFTASKLLSELYEPIDMQVAFRYHKLATAAKDSLFGTGNLQAIQQMLAQDEQRKNEIEAQRIAYQSQLKQYALLVVLGLSLLIGFILYRTYKQQKRVNNLLFHQKETISYQRHKAETALIELRATQAQLIQREKMASLGELTAGIAHEIQNPLNFVNNFAEVSVELVQELGQSVEEDNKPLSKALSADLQANMQHIAQNGQRASNIVRAMLEHSRSSTGVAQPTDLNALAEEYLKLAYQGFRAKDSAFICELITDFDPGLPFLSVVPQDMGRVLLNLYNNAFYAVQQRTKAVGQLVPTGEPEEYQPTVWVGTTTQNGHVEIRVRDNGTGISKAIREKIFQPFFTTKPTGEGTGLGLSLSYDIVTKGHGGTLVMQSLADQYTAFTIQLPIS